MSDPNLLKEVLAESKANMDAFMERSLKNLNIEEMIEEIVPQKLKDGIEVSHAPKAGSTPEQIAKQAEALKAYYQSGKKTKPPETEE